MYTVFSEAQITPAFVRFEEAAALFLFVVFLFMSD